MGIPATGPAEIRLVGKELEEVVARVLADPARINRRRVRRIGLLDPGVDWRGAGERTIGEDRERAVGFSACAVFEKRRAGSIQ